MWPMIAEPNLHCSECRHPIQQGRLCLSELPEETPPGVYRADFQNYCIGCPACWAQGKHACYVRHLESSNSSSPAPRSLPCARCGRKISAGEKVPAEIYYEWPEVTEESATAKNSAATAAIIATATNSETMIRGVPSGSFEDLGITLQRKFSAAGLGGERGFRTTAEAQSFYNQSVPAPIRNLGPEAVKDYLGDKHASHIRSYSNSPELVKVDQNILWDNPTRNQALGAQDMSQANRLQAHGANSFDATRIIFRDCLKSAGIAALVAALMEAPVATIENYYNYQRGRKTGEEAIKDAAKAIVRTATTAGTVAFVVTAAVTLVGGQTVLVTIAPYLITIGTALYSYGALKRILNARAHDLPLHQVGTFFCSSRCHSTFAYETGQSALLRWENNRLN